MLGVGIAFLRPFASSEPARRARRAQAEVVSLKALLAVAMRCWPFDGARLRMLLEVEVDAPSEIHEQPDLRAPGRH